MSARMLIGLLTILALGGCAPITVHPNARGGGSCAGVSERRCLPGEFCDLQPGRCHVQEIAGVCVPQPEVCTRDYRPVCGCNGATYGNDCTRIAAGVQKAHDGECGAAATRPCPHAKQGCPHGKHGCPHAKKGCPHEKHGCPHAKQESPHKMHGCRHEKQH
jgi:hypothetical protein